MTTRIEGGGVAARYESYDASSAAAADVEATDEASASSAPGRSTGLSPSEARPMLASALAGSPEALIAFVVSKLREEREETQIESVDASSSAAEQAEANKREAMAAAAEAAEEASSFLGLSGVFGDIAAVAAIVASVAATVATGGTALALTGAIMVACADRIAQGLVDAGLISPEDAEHVALALKVVGTALMATSVVGAALSIGGQVLATYGDDLANELVDAGVMSAEEGAWLSAGLVIGGSVLASATAGGASGADAPSSSFQHAMSAVAAQMRVVQGGMQIAQGIAGAAGAHAQHTGDHAEADGEVHGARADERRDEMEEAVGDYRDTVKRFARMMRHLREANEARGETLRAAVGMRA